MSICITLRNNISNRENAIKTGKFNIQYSIKQRSQITWDTTRLNRPLWSIWFQDALDPHANRNNIKTRYYPTADSVAAYATTKVNTVDIFVNTKLYCNHGFASERDKLYVPFVIRGLCLTRRGLIHLGSDVSVWILHYTTGLTKCSFSFLFLFQKRKTASRFKDRISYTNTFRFSTTIVLSITKREKQCLNDEQT